jgi:hypothetical protein
MRCKAGAELPGVLNENAHGYSSCHYPCHIRNGMSSSDGEIIHVSDTALMVPTRAT